MFVSMHVTFREPEPFYGEPIDLSLLFAELDHLHFMQDDHEGEKDVSRTQGDSMGTNTNDDVQVQVQPTMGTILIGSLQVHVLVRDRWP